jgi:hypothetical protein
VKHFGAANGMLIVRDYEEVRHVLGSVTAAGFGFSVLEEPDPREPFVLDVYSDVLRDWGWAGNVVDKPSWLDVP